MFLVDALLILAMLFFLFLPISDRRTVQMRLCMLCALLAMFSVSMIRAPVAPVRLASLASPLGMVRVPHMHLDEPSSAFSSLPTSEMRLLQGPGNSQGKF
jgi:hypothetical protein